MMTGVGKEESWGAAQEQIRKENLQNDVEISSEEDEQEDSIVYSPIRIYVNEEADGDDADECHQINAFTGGPDATLKVYEGEADDSLIKIPVTLVVPSTLDSSVMQSDRALEVETGHEPSSCNSSLIDENSNAASSNTHESELKASIPTEKVTSTVMDRIVLNAYIDHPYAFQRMESSVPRGVFQCDQCERIYTSSLNLKNHMRFCGKDPAFCCTVCNYRTAWKSILQQHLVRVHKIHPSQFAGHGVDKMPLDNFSFQCDLCPQKEGAYFKKQKATEHQDPGFSAPSQPTKCPANARSSSKRSGPEKPFKCSKCGRAYSQKCTMKKHFLYECEIEPRLQCTQCDYRTHWKQNLQKHLIRNHEIDPSQLAVFGAGTQFTRAFKCDKCKRAFKYKHNLDVHLHSKKCTIVKDEDLPSLKQQ